MWSVLLSLAFLLGVPHASSAGRALTVLTPPERLALANELIGELDNNACADRLKITLGQVCMVMSWELQLVAAEKVLVHHLLADLNLKDVNPEDVKDLLEDAGEKVETHLASALLKGTIKTQHFKALRTVVEELLELVEDPSALTDDTLRAIVRNLINSKNNNCEDLLTAADSEAIVTNFITSLDEPNPANLIQAIMTELTPIDNPAAVPHLRPIVKQVVRDAVYQLWGVVSVGNVLTMSAIPEARPAVDAMFDILALFERTKIDITRRMHGMGGPGGMGSSGYPPYGGMGSSGMGSGYPSYGGMGSGYPSYGGMGSSYPSYGGMGSGYPSYGGMGSGYPSYGGMGSGYPSYGGMGSGYSSYGGMGSGYSSYGGMGSGYPSYGGMGSGYPSYGGMGSGSPSYGGMGSGYPSYGGMGSGYPSYGGMGSGSPSYGGMGSGSPSYGGMGYSGSPTYGGMGSSGMGSPPYGGMGSGMGSSGMGSPPYGGMGSGMGSSGMGSPPYGGMGSGMGSSGMGSPPYGGMGSGMGSSGMDPTLNLYVRNPVASSSEEKEVPFPLGFPNATATCPAKRITGLNMVVLSVLASVDQSLMRALLYHYLPKPAASELSQIIPTIAADLEPEDLAIKNLANLPSLRATPIADVMITFYDKLPRDDPSWFFSDELLTPLYTMRRILDADQSVCAVDTAPVVDKVVAILRGVQNKYSAATFEGLWKGVLKAHYSDIQINEFFPKFKTEFDWYRAEHASVVADLIKHVQNNELTTDVLLGVLEDIENLFGDESSEESSEESSKESRGIPQRGSAAKHRGSAAKHRGSAAKHPGSAAKHPGSAANQTGSAAKHPGSAANQSKIEVAQRVIDPLTEPSVSDPCRTQRIAALNMVALSVLSGVDQVLLRGMLINSIQKLPAAQVSKIAAELEPEAEGIRDLVKLPALSGSELDKIVGIFHQELPKKRLGYFFQDQLLKNLVIIRGLIDSNNKLCNVDTHVLNSRLLDILEAAKEKYTAANFEEVLDESLGASFAPDTVKEIAGKLRIAFDGYRDSHAKVVGMLISQLRAGGSIKDIMYQVLSDVSGLVGSSLDRVVETRGHFNINSNKVNSINNRPPVSHSVERRGWGWFKKASNTVKNTANTVGSSAVNVANKIGSGAVNVANQVGSTASNVANDVANKVGGSASKLANSFVSSWGRSLARRRNVRSLNRRTRGWGWFKKAGNTIKDTANKIASGTSNLANSFVNTWNGKRRSFTSPQQLQARGWFKKAAKSFKKTANKVASGAKNAANEVASGTTNLANGVANTWKGNKRGY